MNTVQNKVFSEFSNNLSPGRKLVWVTVFAISMAMLESAVVIYLRELYYPDGFEFPLKITSQTVAITELLRELATIIMLAGIGILAGVNKHERFAWFIYCFAIWDIFYYVFLFAIINWPASLLTLDVLFLLPLMWVGPVWAPLLLSFLMIVLALFILHFSQHSHHARLKSREWFLLIAGSLTVIISFCSDFYRVMKTLYPDIPVTRLFFSKESIEYSTNYIPVSFDIALFLFGCILIITGIASYLNRNRKYRLL